MKIILVFLSALVFGCAHVADKGQAFKDSDEVMQNPALQDLAINIRCAIVDLNGKHLRKFPGLFCSYLDDGSFFVSQVALIKKYDKNLNAQWEFKLNMNHHQMVLSPYTSNLLTLDTFDYKEGTQIYRGDSLLILSPEGQLLKRINFNDILSQAEKLGYKKKPAVEAFWITKRMFSKESVLEFSHVNSFYEIWDQQAGKVTGYIVNCYHQQKIYFLDASGEKLVSVIDMDGRNIHDVQLYKNKLFYYVNSDQTMKDPWLSYIGAYDMETKKSEVVYRSDEGNYSANACSSVQVLADGLFAVLHSNCAPTPQTTSVARFEIIDVHNKIRYRPKLEKYYLTNNAYLFNSKSFLMNNKGL